MPNDHIHHLDDLAARAWPAAIVHPLDGWQLRFTEGITRRANSVWPCAASPSDPQPLPNKLARVEEFYASHSLPARYYISPAAQPPELDAVLAERGYRLDAPTCVQTTTLARVVERTRPTPGLLVTVANRPDERWFAAYCQAEGFSGREAEVRRGILLRIGGQTGFAVAQMGRERIAVGLGVLAGEWLGVFCMATRPECRRRGAARAVLRTLVQWGQQRGGKQMYLQVMEENAAAQALYKAAGLETLYGYHYREAPVVLPRSAG